jgi:hypothetical protein
MRRCVEALRGMGACWRAPPPAALQTAATCVGMTAPAYLGMQFAPWASREA